MPQLPLVPHDLYFEIEKNEIYHCFSRKIALTVLVFIFLYSKEKIQEWH
jgi:hypothetical protein